MEDSEYASSLSKVYGMMPALLLQHERFVVRVMQMHIDWWMPPVRHAPAQLLAHDQYLCKLEDVSNHSVFQLDAEIMLCLCCQMLWL
eukprot:5842543-Amphidinium_carterae.2